MRLRRLGWAWPAGTVALALGVAFGVAFGSAAPALAAGATVQVSGTSMTSGCTLPDAVAFADNPGVASAACGVPASGGTITIDVPAGTYVLPKTLALTGGANVVIDGSGSAATLFDGNHSVEPISVAAGAHVTINDVGVEDGSANSGGGISNAGTLTLNDDVVTDNSTGSGANGAAGAQGTSGSPNGGQGEPGGNGGDGGGISNTGTLTIAGTSVTDNKTGSGGSGGAGGDAFMGGSNPEGGGAGGSGGDGGSGGGIYTVGPTSITASTIAGNKTGGGGEGADGGQPFVTGSSPVQPSQLAGRDGNGGDGGSGGGLFATTSLTLHDSTITANSTASGGAGASGGEGAEGVGGTSGGGAGLSVDGAGQPLEQDTIAGNAAASGGTGGGVTGSVQLGNSIVASNTPSNCSTGVTGTAVDSLSTNIVFGDSSCSGFTSGNPKLGLLADNGGPTETMALQPGSAALNFDSSCTGDDQRGVARLQPGAGDCDAGAYQHAAPAISAVGATATPSSATVSAQVNPNWSTANTSVVLQYGTTAAYGSTVTQTIARGGAAVALRATLSGLAPDTTYHYRLVATNGEVIAGPDGTPGQTVTGDETFTTPPPAPPPAVVPRLTASLRSVSTSGATAKLKISCAGGGAGAVCSGPITLSAHETLQGKAIKAVAAAKKPVKGSKKPVKGTKGSKKKKKKKKRKMVTKLTTVAGSRYSVSSGKSKTISVSLNRKARALLAKFYKLPATVSLGGTGTATERVRFAYPKVKAIVLYTARWNGHGVDTISDITVRQIPKGAKVKLACRSGDCSPRSKTISVKRGSVLSLGKLKVTLRRKATVAFEVTRAGEVGHVLELRDTGRGGPKQSILCLPPGAKKPAKCA